MVVAVVVVVVVLPGTSCTTAVATHSVGRMAQFAKRMEDRFSYIDNKYVKSNNLCYTFECIIVQWVYSIIVVDFDFFYMCECAVGVDVRDGATTLLSSIVVQVVMGCIVLGRQMNVDFTIFVCKDTHFFVGMDVHFCTMKIHDSMRICSQPVHSIVVHRRIIQSDFCIGTKTTNPTLTILHKITSCCCSSGTIIHTYSRPLALCETTLRYINIGPTSCTIQTVPTVVCDSQFFKFNMLLLVHLKPTKHCRFTFSFTNKGNVATTDSHAQKTTDDCKLALTHNNSNWILRRAFVSL